MIALPDPMERHRFKADAGTILLAEGDASTHVLFLHHGYVDAFRDARRLGQFGPGSVLGELAVLHREARAATLQAATEVELSRMEADEFLRWYRQTPELRAQLERQRILYEIAPLQSAAAEHAACPANGLSERRLSVEHESTGRLRVWRGDQPAADEWLHAEVGTSKRSLGLKQGVPVEIVIEGIWPRLGTAVTCLLEGESIDERARERFVRRGELVSGGTFDELVCVCRGVSGPDIRRTALGGVESPEQVAQRLGIAGGCGRCRERLHELVWEARTETQPDRVPPASCPRGSLANVRRGWLRVPILGDAALLKQVILDPIGLVERAKAAQGEAIRIPIPTRFDLIYLGQDAFEAVLELPATVAQMGPVMANVPSIGFWFPRAASDHDSLQQLMLTGRSILSGCVRRAMERDAFRSLAHAAIDRSWPSTPEVPDVLEPVARIFADTAAAAIMGEALWNELRAPCLDLLRDIHDGIDVTRATLASTPISRFMPEYRATREIEAPLRDIIARHVRSAESVGLHHLLKDPELPVQPDDQPWMLLFLLWNATIYPGSYGAWTFADIVTHERWACTVMAETAPRREQRWAHAFLETTRLWPVGSLVRSLREPVTIESGGCAYALQAGQVVGVFPWERNRQPERWPEAERWLPDRWLETPGREGLFGLGEFRCVAEAFNERLFGCVLDAIFERFTIEPLAPLPERRCRVHLTYPEHPWPARLGARAPSGSVVASDYR